MEILHAIILGIIQGLTEFLPVSSSGHLEIVKALLGEEKVIDFNSEEIWKQMVEQFISQMIPVCKKLICR